MSKKNGIKVQPLLLEDPDEALGANTTLELQELERACQRIKAKKLVNSGVNIADIDRIDSRGSLAVGRGSVIVVNNVFEGCVERGLSIIHIAEPTRCYAMPYAVFRLKKKTRSTLH